jgi:hypothetical protein
MNRKRVFLTILSSVCLAATILAGPVPASAQRGGFGTSTSGGSGAIATGPTGFTGVFGGSSAGGSGGFATGSTNFQPPGLSTGGGSDGRSTRATNPARPQFGGG